MTEQKQLNVDSQRRFRATHRRIDYAPRPGIWTIIEQHIMEARVKSLTRVIDHLILAGHEAITGNLNELHIAGMPGTEHTVEIQHRSLTSRQEAFASTVATSNQSLTACYRTAYNTQNAKPETVNKMAAELAALPHVAARIRALRGGVAAAMVKKAAHTREDAINEAGILAERAMARGQISVGVAAIKLRAQLAGFLPSGRKSRRSKDAAQSDLTDADNAALIEMRDEVCERLQREQDAFEMVGALDVTVPAAPVPARRVID